MRIIADAKIPAVLSTFGQLGNVRLLDSERIHRGSVGNADVVLVRSETRVDARLLEGTRVRFVGSATIGQDHVDLDYLREARIGFANAPGSNADSVTQYVVAALLFLGGRKGLKLGGKTLGVVGVGSIGSRVVQAARALGMEVILNDPPLARLTSSPDFRPLDALLDADFLTLHVPLVRGGTDPTWHLFDEKRLATFKPATILINTSRGAVVETGALKEFLSRGRLEAAVVDVWENEPAIDIDLMALATIATAHIAGYALEGKLRGAHMLYEAVCRHFDRSPVACRGAVPATHEAAEVDLSGVADPEEVLRRAVKACYDIQADDVRLRRLTRMPPAQRAGYFRRLRKNYPVRHEFSTLRVILSDQNRSCGETLRQLGFQTGEP
ncbi:MAG: 4-phosphoerythronate dehydrogenase [Acidobacteriota bacterium]